jgi:hypothetical protein
MSPADGSGTEHIRRIVEGAEQIKLEPPRPLVRVIPPADPFPVDALGSVLAPAARAINDRVQAPIAICGQSVLGAATLAVQGGTPRSSCRSDRATVDRYRTITSA